MATLLSPEACQPRRGSSTTLGSVASLSSLWTSVFPSALGDPLDCLRKEAASWVISVLGTERGWWQFCIYCVKAEEHGWSLQTLRLVPMLFVAVSPFWGSALTNSGAGHRHLLCPSDDEFTARAAGMSLGAHLLHALSTNPLLFPTASLGPSVIYYLFIMCTSFCLHLSLQVRRGTKSHYRWL